MKHYKRPWDETRGDNYDHWGKSIWFIETDESGLPTRQIEKYENGQVLKYDLNNPEDEFGMLGDQELDLDEFEEFKITLEEFDKNWIEK